MSSSPETLSVSSLLDEIVNGTKHQKTQQKKELCIKMIDEAVSKLSKIKSQVNEAKSAEELEVNKIVLTYVNKLLDV
jgi:translation initiation factor 2B subunit (eIF-2B alpha/beta/delta family)